MPGGGGALIVLGLGYPLHQAEFDRNSDRNLAPTSQGLESPEGHAAGLPPPKEKAPGLIFGSIAGTTAISRNEVFHWLVCILPRPPLSIPRCLAQTGTAHCAMPKEKTKKKKEKKKKKGKTQASFSEAER